MKLSAIALDYDGTIAFHDRLEPSVRDAIAAVRARGIAVLLVTGRTLGELQRVAGSLHFADVVVAENGALLHYPAQERTSLLAPEVPEAFLLELRRRNVPFGAGRCLVDLDANESGRVLETIRALQVPLVMAFNVGRVMVLSQGVSKATGLQSALSTLRLSPRNTLAIGDAENDHEMLRHAEIGVAVEWGSPTLKASADAVLTGNSPSAVATYLHRLAASGLMPPAVRPRRRLLLGRGEDGAELALAVRGRNVLLTGDPKSGKSWIAGLLCEQLILHGYGVCVIDPEGDYRSLEGLPGVEVLGGDDPPPTPRQLLRALRFPDRSVVIDLSQRSHEEKLAYVPALLSALAVVRRRTGLPHRILIDEAHYYLHNDADVARLDFEHGGYTVVTYCASRLPASLLDSTEVAIVTCESNPIEIDTLFNRCVGCAPGQRSAWDALSRLTVGHAIALPMTEESGGVLRQFSAAPRMTPHVRHRQKYVDVPVGEHHAFIFGNGTHRRVVETLRRFVEELETRPGLELVAYARRGDFSRWIDGVFGDRALARELTRYEAKYASGVEGPWLADIAAAIRARYDMSDDLIARTAAEGVRS